MRRFSTSLLLGSSVILVLAVAVSLFCLVDAVMTLPQMHKEATHVWKGTVEEVDEKDHDQPGFISWKNRHYRLTVKVTGVSKSRGYAEKLSHHHKHEEHEQELRHEAENLPPHKGEGAVEHPDHVQDEFHDDESIEVGDLVHVHFWKALARPPGYKLPDSPGINGMSDAVAFEVGKEYAFFGEYLNRDQIRRYMYHHTHPGNVRRRKHTSSKSASKSKSDVEAAIASGNAGDVAASQQQEQPVEEFTYVKAYIAFVPDGITSDVEGAFAAASGESSSASASKKLDL